MMQATDVQMIADRWMLESRRLINWGSYEGYHEFRPSTDHKLPVTLLAGASESGKSTLGDAQARRLGIRIKGKDGSKYFAHTLNNTCVAPPRMLIAFLENNLNADGSIRIPAPLRPYMGGKEVLVPAK